MNLDSFWISDIGSREGAQDRHGFGTRVRKADAGGDGLIECPDSEHV